jgi:cytochrome c peroxidase
MSDAKRIRSAAVVTLLLCGCVPPSGVDESRQALKPPASQSFSDVSGQLGNLDTDGAFDTTGPFFQSLGTNGRSCASCHQASDAWSIAPAHVQQIFDATSGTDPLFRPVDGANSPAADVSTVDARRAAYSLLLEKGLIRVGMAVPANAEFEVSAIDDPYSAATPQLLSCYRRPLPATNLRFLTTVMWDGRESAFGQSLDDHLLHQAGDATLGHAQASVAPTTDQVRGIVDFEMGLTSAQGVDNDAANLDAKNGNGGASYLSTVPFHFGINDVLGGDPSPVPFTPSAMTLYASWQGAKGAAGSTDAARGAIARGQNLFNTKPIAIAGVGGLNDALAAPTIAGTCTSCHDTPNVGNHSLPLPIDIGLTDASRRSPDLPLYTLTNLTTGDTRQTTDPGRALVTGRWKDIGKFKGPILRGLAARAPYFHNGSAASVEDVINFYDSRFSIGFSADEKSDLAAFLRAL